MSTEPFQFSERAQAFLDKAGWFPERRIDTTEFEQILTEMDCPFFPAVKDFLSRFGGIEIDLKSDFAYLSFSTQGYQTVSKDRVQDYIERIGKPLCLIGVIQWFDAMWFMDAEGKVYEYYPYGGSELLGYSGEEAIGNEINGIYPQESS